MLEVLHSNDKEQFRKFFEHDRVDRFEERFSILKVFLQTEQHVTFSELLELLSVRNIKIDSKLVNDTLRLMCMYGFARKHRFENGDIRYEHLHLGQKHDHMICVKCNGIFEFEDEKLKQIERQIASNLGFHVLQHRIELYGICSKCMMSHEKTSSIAEASQGEQVVISGFNGGKKAISRLSSVGLRIGDKIEIIANSSNGQLVIALGQRRLILCREFAKKIIVDIKIDRELSNK